MSKIVPSDTVEGLGCRVWMEKILHPLESPKHCNIVVYTSSLVVSGASRESPELLQYGGPLHISCKPHVCRCMAVTGEDEYRRLKAPKLFVKYVSFPTRQNYTQARQLCEGRSLLLLQGVRGVDTCSNNLDIVPTSTPVVVLRFTPPLPLKHQ